MKVQKKLAQITKDLEMVSKMVQELTASLGQAEVKRAKVPKAVSGNRGNSGAATVLNIIKKSKKGIDALTLIKKTGFDDKKVRNILFHGLKSQKIQRVSRGIYKISK
jgi:hypothetical protein